MFMHENNQGLGLFKLTCFAIGTTLASGVFSMFRDMAASGAGTLAVLLGWAITGIGMFALTMCFNRLSLARPHLKSGIFAYAHEGFGEYIGFNSAWGYWISAILSQVSFATLLFAALGQFFPIFGAGNNLVSILTASAVVWGFTLLVMGGVQEAVTVNTIIVLAKIVPILAFIVFTILLGAFDIDIFLENFRGQDTGLSLGRQILETTYTTVWIFTGIEGAVVISGRARSTAVAGRATALSFLTLLILYVLISILSMGIMPRDELAALGNPAMAGLLASIVGPWGATLINIGVIISIAGAMFSYTIVCADSAYAPALAGCFPKFLQKENKAGAPVGALILTALVIQGFLIMVYFQESSYQAMYTLATSAIMIPFVLSASYCLKATLEDSGILNSSATPGHPVTLFTWLISIGGTVYGFYMLLATGIGNVIISAFCFAPGFFVYAWSRKQANAPIFASRADAAAFGVIIIFLVIALL